jgi:hypothetical protein
LELEEMQELRVVIRVSLLLLLREAEQVAEMVLASLLPLVGQVAEVQMVEQLVRMGHLDRAIRAETGLAGRVCKVVQEAVELVLLVRMEQLVCPVMVVLG